MDPDKYGGLGTHALVVICVCVCVVAWYCFILHGCRVMSFVVFFVVVVFVVVVVVPLVVVV